MSSSSPSPPNSVVFITNKSISHDYSAAEEFGALKFVTMGNYPIFKIDRLTEEVIESLLHSKPTDYLLLSGTAVVAGLCMMIWIELHGKAKILLWDRADSVYVLKEIVRKDIRLEIERVRAQAEAAPR